MATVGVIPAAGYATRLQPLECSKEVYPVRGRPMMDFVIERMRCAPCDELRVVTRPDKADVIAHAEARGAAVITGHPTSLAASLICGIVDLSFSDTVLIGFPDSIWEPADGYRRVVSLLHKGWKVGLGLFWGDEMQRYESVVTDENGRVARIEFKPAVPPSNWLWGCAAASVETLTGMRGFAEPGIFFDSLAQTGEVGAVRLPGEYIDMGTPDALRSVLNG